jgi:hypothetical protein
MSILLTTLTILTLSVCGPSKNTVTESLEVTKTTKAQKQKTVIYKKVPTKWVKITKKSN